ncbi:hypothetical protein EC991_000326 [Linnemannia zychae]|nr:hypothetical protein EC991_000326 [Linnemannia zychae]
MPIQHILQYRLRRKEQEDLHLQLQSNLELIGHSIRTREVMKATTTTPCQPMIRTVLIHAHIPALKMVSRRIRIQSHMLSLTKGAIQDLAFNHADHLSSTKRHWGMELATQTRFQRC